MRRKITIGFLFALAMTTPGVAGAAIDPETKVALDTVWVLVTAFLVFWMNAGFALVESGLCQAKNAVNILAKNFIVFAVSSLAFWVDRLRPHVRRRQSVRRADRAGMMHGADNSPATGDAYQGVFTAAQLDRRAAVGEVLLPARVRRNGGDDRLRRRRRTHQVRRFHHLLLHPGGASSTRSSATGSGAAAGCRRRGFRDFAGSTVVHSHRRLGGAGGRHRSRPAHRQVQAGRQGQADPRPQHDVGDARRV